jgi:NAD+ diphosphatase
MSASLLEAAATGDLDYIKSNTKALKDKNERGWTALHFAARYGQLAVATYLRDSVPELLDMENNEGKTPSQLAQFWGYDQVAELLTPAATTPATDASETEAVVAKQVNHVNFFAGSPLNRQVVQPTPTFFFSYIFFFLTDMAGYERTMKD